MSFLVSELEDLRDRLRRRGQRQSMVLPTAKPDVVEAIAVLEEYGALCEAMYLVMAADRRVLNVEREVLRGALDVLSSGRVRTAHMEAMIDAAARKLAEQGEGARLEAVIRKLADDPDRGEATLILGAAVAAADDRISAEEHAVLRKIAAGLGIDDARRVELLARIAADLR